jgi:glycosyltransferase involved in cell wall biosynthesis
MPGSAVSESDLKPPDPETIVLAPPHDLPDQRTPGKTDSARTARAQNGRRLAARSSTGLSVVVPTLDEAANLEYVLPQLARFDEVIIVDGMSSDGTPDLVRRLRPDAQILERPPRGKGDALRAGFEAATRDVIVMMDADGSMDPREVDGFVALIELGYDLVKGSRVMCGGGSHDLTMIRSLGNKVLCWLGNRLFRTSWTDLCYGYIAIRRSCVPQLALTGIGFEIETEILARAALANLRMAELPSIEMPRLYGDSHLHVRRDGIRVLRTMIGAWCTPRARRMASNLRPVVR